MAPPKLVIFDCDGVLVDTEGLANRRLSQWLTEAGYAASYEHCRKHFSGRSMASVQAEIEGTGVKLGYDLPTRWYGELDSLFASGVEAIPHIRDFVETVRAAGIAYCVASSARISKMNVTLGKTGLLPLFEHAMFSATMVARAKPFPDIFLHAAQAMGSKPADCIVIEDSVAGTTAGIAAGMRVFSYCGDPHAEREGLASAGGILFEDMRALAPLVPIN